LGAKKGINKTIQKTEGKTPAEACDIELKGENKWIT
jgi:hypothetical protein